MRKLRFSPHHDSRNWCLQRNCPIQRIRMKLQKWATVLISTRWELIQRNWPLWVYSDGLEIRHYFYICCCVGSTIHSWTTTSPLQIKSSNGCGPNCSSIITTTTRKLSSKELTEGSVTHGDGMSFSSLSTSEPTSVSSTHFASIADFLESNSGTDSMKQNVSLSGKHNSTDNETSTASPDSTLLNNGTGSSDPKPSPVFDIQAIAISTDKVNLTWKNNDTSADNYTYVILKAGTEFPNITVLQKMQAVIMGLEPGTLYNFTIYPVAPGSTTEGDRNSTTVYTKPSPVFDIQAIDISTDYVNLTWKNNDLAADNYSYMILGDSASFPNITIFEKRQAVITGLKPGTLYNITIYPLAPDNATKGDGNSTTVYTKPSPVFDIQAIDISTDYVNLTWKNNDSDADNYTYMILGNSASFPNSTIFQKRQAVITGLEPGTLYNITIYPLAPDNATKGDGNSTIVYTKPSPVFAVQAIHISTDQVNLTWKNNDAAADKYTYEIKFFKDGNLTLWPEKPQITGAVITGLEPGTLYNFTIYPLAPDNTTRGDGNSTSVYTKPSPVFAVQAIHISTDQVNLTWKNNDAAADKYTYEIQFFKDGNLTFWPEKPQITGAVITGLEPGTLYNFTIYPLAPDNTTRGDGNSTSVYTEPSPVFDIQAIDISTDYVNLTWKNDDSAADNYIYVIEIFKHGTLFPSNKTLPKREAVITGLEPGTSYHFKVFPLALDNRTWGYPNSTSVCTNAAPPHEFKCEQVPRKPELKLNWLCPLGNNSGFRIKISNGIRTNESSVSSCKSGNVEKSIDNLTYYTTFYINITTHSCGKDSLPEQRTCATSITDPPAPSAPPAITGIDHNSFKVQFSPFKSEHGPLKAYAVLITTANDNQPSKYNLNLTYHDFKTKKTHTYVTYVMNIEHTRASLSTSRSQPYTVVVGNANTTHAYYNGPLEPLGLYRTSVAGFTDITYANNKTGPIVEERSYVSFTPYSEPFRVPQDPGVIVGAVLGSILCVSAVLLVVVFVFWRRRRKDGKNNDVSFSQIKPKKSKPIKVENFESYFKTQQADSNCGFAEEYEELRPAGVHQPKFAAELAENRGKNRYNNVLPYDISRVKLSAQSHPTDDYINANYMPGYNLRKEFIAAQGPLPNTLEDFWRMIWEKNIYAIVMLTKCIEQGRTKCEQYWADKQPMSYGDITVTMTSEIVLAEWTIRDFTIEDNNETDSHCVRQFHFTAWPDHGVPETTELLISFRHLVEEYARQNPPESPTLVHCSAGVGRTGTFIAIDRLIQQIEMENTADVYGVVYDLRMHRPLMVQTEEQYVFLNQCVLDIIKSQRDKKVDLIYQNTTAMAIYENLAPAPNFGKANGYCA
ncbi:receptor-type tyrosine-protein phosphatase eta isoform X2 [Alligator sinensis]|uniref:Receptor-type tyrosine-protein phosphatase eta n=1 Tax=Alligator sinensis TaxID=38654 RepID=A0A1U7RE68_ALLSI|nr:receptor-type tyrosine-protein phosphatase eta isoform X2 [Alligator sinensis]